MPYVDGQWVADGTGDDRTSDTPQESPTSSIDFQPAASSSTSGAPKMPQDRNGPTFDYGNGIVATKNANGGWDYPWQQSYADLLGDTQVQGARDLQTIRSRAGSEGLRLDAADAGLSNIYAANGNDIERTLAALRGGQSGSSAAPSFQNSNPTFSDPQSRLVEDYALQRFHHLQNPDPNSGTALYEQYARDLVNTLKGPVYSPGDEAVIKGHAIDTIMQDRDATKQRWLEEVSRRGFAPTSGPALQGLLEIDNHYGGLKTQVDAQFAKDAIQQTRDQRFQTADVLSKLSQSEEGRLDQAGTYAKMPLQLSNDAFSRGLSLVNASGNPAQTLQSALSAYNAITADQRLASQDQQQAIESILQFIASMG